MDDDDPEKHTDLCQEPNQPLNYLEILQLIMQYINRIGNHTKYVSKMKISGSSNSSILASKAVICSKYS